MADVDRNVEEDAAVTPKIYDYARQAGQWFQGRGQNVHGVDDPNASKIQDPAPEYTDPQNEAYVDDYPEPEPIEVMTPIPVTVVETPTPPVRRKFRVLKPTINPNLSDGTAKGTMILGNDPTRVRALVKKSVGADSWYFSHDSQVTASTGFEVSSTEIPVEILGTNAVYAIHAGTSGFQQISVYVEYLE